MSPELELHLRLALVPGLGPKLTAAVLTHFGTPQAVLSATAAELQTVPLIGAKLAGKFADAFRKVDVAAELDQVRRHGVRIAVRGTADYPAKLAALPDAPPLLYFRGDLVDLDTQGVAIVGSRNCTSYGKRVAERMAADFARRGVTVISGLARGIDGCAHVGALDGGGRTVAVLAGGLGSIYPPEHADLAERVTTAGCLLTETPMTVQPQPGMFPARNRIISGLARCVIVVEANLKSGALITVDHAAEQGREVFVVPGPVDSPASAGCLDLIRNGARLVRTAEDVLEDLQGLKAPPSGPRPTARPTSQPTLLDTLTVQPVVPPPVPPAVPTFREPIHEAIWKVLDEPKHADEVCRAVELTASDAGRILMMMEMQKLIQKLPGNRYERRR